MFKKTGDRSGEVTLYSGRMSWCRSEQAALDGYGFLTDKQLRFDMPEIAKLMTKIFFKPFSNAFADGVYDIAIPCDDIKSVSPGTYGFRKALVIERKDGTRYKFAVNHYDRWEQAVLKRMTKIA
ncbi:hypothetical protein [Trichococcus ilyis]|uniref:Uncharacterized protein n=1 Tax=Trichococcus ilyis TaxID=640938 RepID=A0A143YX94_9LACT|nr:hypothetical protein [Trichococcus ilyis]CZQ99039.1 Hypothetical protein TR210_1610 [Trichococcus ilyis]SEJ13611.1 hypothetical protein SAMN05216375_10848 [Trichococcus ilyis]